MTFEEAVCFWNRLTEYANAADAISSGEYLEAEPEDDEEDFDQGTSDKALHEKVKAAFEYVGDFEPNGPPAIYADGNEYIQVVKHIPTGRFIARDAYYSSWDFTTYRNAREVVSQTFTHEGFADKPKEKSAD